MRFNKDFLVIVETLTKEEASAFIKFLQSEIIRHNLDITQAEELIEYVKEKLWK